MVDCDFQVDPERLTDVAVRTIALIQRLTGRAGDFVEGALVPVGAFGDSPAATELRAATVRLTQAAESLLSDLQGVLELDVDSLYRSAFAYRETDECHQNFFQRAAHQLVNPLS